MPDTLFERTRTASSSRHWWSRLAGVELLRGDVVLPALVSGGLSLVCILVLPPGSDAAAHAFRLGLFDRHGLVLWNGYWYDGSFAFANYSLAYYPFAAFLGRATVAALSCVVTTWAAAVVISTRWPGSLRAVRVASWTFACLWPLVVIAGELPFLLGAAFGSAALLAFQRRMGFVTGLLAFAALLSSPMALLGVCIPVMAVILSGGIAGRGRCALWLSAAVAAGVVLLRLFPGTGAYPFPLLNLVECLVMAVAILLLFRHAPHALALRTAAMLYAIASIVLFFWPSEVGANMDRARFVFVPVLVFGAALRSWRPRWLLVPALVVAFAWALYPAESVLSAQADRSEAQAAFWKPAIQYLHRHLVPSYRVEVVDTRSHWGADYLPSAGIPIARGWLRQMDFPANALLYQADEFTAASYLRWLRRQAIAYVVLPHTQLDTSGLLEARYLRSGETAVRPVLRSSTVTVYRTTRPVPIVSFARRPSGSVSEEVQTHYGLDAITTRLPEAGTYLVAARWSPYWQTSTGCLAQSANGFVDLAVSLPATVRLWVSLSWSGAYRALAGLSGRTGPGCSGGG